MSYYICSKFIMLLSRLHIHDKSAGGKFLSSFAFLQTYQNLMASPKEGENSEQSTLLLKIGTARGKKGKQRLLIKSLNYSPWYNY